MCDSGSPRVYSLPDTKPGSFPSDPLTRSSRWFGIAHDLAGSLAPLQISGRKGKALAELSSTTQVLGRRTRQIRAQRPTGNLQGADAPTPDGTTVGVIPQNRAERPIHRDQRSEKNSHETHGASHREPVGSDHEQLGSTSCEEGPHMRSGASIPRRWRPWARTSRVAAANARREERTSPSERSTGQAS